MTIEEKISALQEQKTALVAYLHSKIAAEDWHAVVDACMDIREIVAALKVLDA